MSDMMPSDADPRGPVAFQKPRPRTPVGGNSSYYEDRARTQKALKLANHLQLRGITSDHLETMHPHILAHHAASAGVNAPSPETWETVSKLMVNHEASQAESKKPGYDPFAGL
jgi:hypothetical protein